jgi:MtaA/CmuA family methyltransferase
MNGKQRIQMALSGRMPDRTPIMLHNFLMAIRENGYTVAQYRKDPKVIANVFCNTVDKYGVDGILLEMDTALLASCVGASVDYPEDEPARVFGSMLSSASDVSRLKPVNFSSTRAMVVLEAASRIVERIGGDCFIRGNCDQAAFSLAGLIRGLQDFMVDLLTEEPEPIRDLLEYAYQVAADFMTLMRQTGVDMVSNGDSPASPDLISPAMYRKWAFEYEKRLADHAHSLGLPYMIHICGNTTAILPDIVATGSDALELDYRTSLDAICRATFGKTCFCGNVDPSGILCLGSRADVVRETSLLLDSQRDNPRFILNAGCAIPATTPEENLLAFVSTGRAYERRG